MNRTIKTEFKDLKLRKKKQFKINYSRHKYILAIVDI